MEAFEKNIRRVDPYVPGEQPRQKAVKLNTNENPYPPAPGVANALREMDPADLRLYPDPACHRPRGGAGGLSPCRKGPGVYGRGVRRGAGPL